MFSEQVTMTVGEWLAPPEIRKNRGKQRDFRGGSGMCGEGKGAGGGTLNPAERSSATSCADKGELRTLAGSLKWFLHPSTTSKYGAPLWGTPYFGAGGGTRTHTMSPSTDFESVTSANSITPAYISPSLRTTGILYHSFMEKSSTPEEFLGGFS